MNFTEEVNDHHYGKCKVYSQPGLEHRVCIVKNNIQRDEETDMWTLKDLSNAHLNIDHESIIKLYRFTIEKQSLCCSSHWRISHFYE